MTVIYVVIPLALVMASIAVAAFLWAARDGQFDDLSTGALRPLIDDAPPAPRADAETGRRAKP